MATKNSINSNIPIGIAKGGTNASSMTNTNGVAYFDGTSLVTTAVGTAAHVLTSNGAGSAPTFQALPADSISITGDTGGALSGNSFTFSGGSTGLSFDGAGSTETLSFAGITANGGAVNLGTDAAANDVNIGTGAAARDITIGNNTGATSVAIDIGTGDFSLSSASGNLMSVLNTGEINYPLLPAFSARSTAAVSNATGDGTVYTIIPNTELFDQNGDYNSTTGIFTAPVTGKYQFAASPLLDSITSSHTFARLRFVTTPLTRTFDMGSIAAMRDSNNKVAFAFLIFATLTAGDTVNLTIQVNNGTKVVGVYASFSGFLVC